MPSLGLGSLMGGGAPSGHAGTSTPVARQDTPTVAQDSGRSRRGIGGLFGGRRARRGGGKDDRGSREGSRQASEDEGDSEAGNDPEREPQAEAVFRL